MAAADPRLGCLIGVASGFLLGTLRRGKVPLTGTYDHPWGEREI